LFLQWNDINFRRLALNDVNHFVISRWIPNFKVLKAKTKCEI